ncbi:hypothetical protein TNCT6_40080 [Streptomyces sp. 6-11-2]|nr:hypothetical protein TNCT6_40080 [Streptomyces sp. 6-11-2]
MTGGPRTRDMRDTAEVFVTELKQETYLPGGLRDRMADPVVRMSGQTIDRGPCPALEPGEPGESRRREAEGSRWRAT